MAACGTSSVRLFDGPVRRYQGRKGPRGVTGLFGAMGSAMAKLPPRPRPGVGALKTQFLASERTPLLRPLCTLKSPLFCAAPGGELLDECFWRDPLGVWSGTETPVQVGVSGGRSLHEGLGMDSIA